MIPQRRRARAAAFTLTLVAAGAALTACSGSQGGSSSASPSVDPTYLLSQATTNAKAATAVHMRGTGQCDLGTFVVDMDLAKDGAAAGSVQIGGQTISLVGQASALYMHGSQQFWQAQTRDASRVANKWVKVSRAGSPCLNALTNLPVALANYLGYTGKPAVVTGDQVGGVPARLISLDNNVSIWISRSGTLLPVNVHDTSTATDITFSGWNNPVAVTVPQPTLTVDGSTLRPA